MNTNTKQTGRNILRVSVSGAAGLAAGIGLALGLSTLVTPGRAVENVTPSPTLTATAAPTATETVTATPIATPTVKVAVKNGIPCIAENNKVKTTVGRQSGTTYTVTTFQCRTATTAMKWVQTSVKRGKVSMGGKCLSAWVGKAASLSGTRLVCTKGYSAYLWMPRGVTSGPTPTPTTSFLPGSTPGACPKTREANPALWDACYGGFVPAKVVVDHVISCVKVADSQYAVTVKMRLEGGHYAKVIWNDTWVDHTLAWYPGANTSPTDDRFYAGAHTIVYYYAMNGASWLIKMDVVDTNYRLRPQDYCPAT